MSVFITGNFKSGTLCRGTLCPGDLISGPSVQHTHCRTPNRIECLTRFWKSKLKAPSNEQETQLWNFAALLFDSLNDEEAATMGNPQKCHNLAKCFKYTAQSIATKKLN